MIQKELDAGVELERMDDNSRDENPYKELIVNNASRVDDALTQIEQWSIISNVITYVQYHKNAKNFYSMIIKPARLCKTIKSTKSRNVNESLLDIYFI